MKNKLFIPLIMLTLSFSSSFAERLSMEEIINKYKPEDFEVNIQEETIINNGQIEKKRTKPIVMKEEIKSSSYILLIEIKEDNKSKLEELNKKYSITLYKSMLFMFFYDKKDTSKGDRVKFLAIVEDLKKNKIPFKVEDDNGILIKNDTLAKKLN